MAVTREGDRLTEGHRQEQLRLKAGFLAEFLRLWPLLNPSRLDTTAPEWLRLVVALMTDWRLKSTEAGLGYYRVLRVAEAGRSDVLSVADLPSDRFVVAANRSLAVTGPVNIRHRIERGADPDEAARAALVEASGAGSRHVLNGGREAVLAAAEADPAAVGWARITDGDPCFFCALLASRGFVYRSEDTAKFQANGVDRYHDDCGCTAEPTFTRDAPLPGRAQNFLDLYVDSAAGYSGGEARNAFRRAYEAQQRAQRAS